MTERYVRGLGDTNILILLEWLGSEHLPLDLLISTVTLAELATGVHSAADVGERARRIARLQCAEAVFDPLPFDAESARQYGVIAAARKPRGRVADLMIASVAAANKLPLFTTNPGDFRGLEAAVTVVPVPVPVRRDH